MSTHADLVYGRRAVEEALATPDMVNRLYVAKERRRADLQPLLDAAKAGGASIELVPLAKLDSMVGARDHQGIAARVSPVSYAGLSGLLSELTGDALLLVLDNVQHPRNLGMILRSAAAAGVDGVVLPERGAALVDDTVMRASAGMARRVTLVRAPNLSKALRTLKDADIWVYGLAGEGAMNVFEHDWPARCALVTGNETSGLRHGVAKNCDALLRIPRQEGVESLNAAVATSLAAYQAAWAQGRLTG